MNNENLIQNSERTPSERRENAAKAEFDSLSVKLKSQEAKLKDFCKSTDRKVDKFRVQVNGFDKSVSQKAVWAEKKTVANSAGSGIIKTDERFDLHPNKIRKFLLFPGAKHSKEFFDVGYKENDYETLFDDIANGFDITKAVEPRITPGGKESISIFMNLGVNKKRTFRTVWERVPPNGKPRFITAYRSMPKEG